jgi:glycosyltransferase involved in cell wall biosynthesis
MLISFIVENSNKIVLSSRFCEKDCNEMFPSTANKTHVMPFAVSIDEKSFGFRDFASIRDKYQLQENFLIVANLFAPTKNHKTLFEALGILKRRGMRIPLVCTGNIVDYRNQAFANEILQMLTENKIRDQVHLLGLIPRSDQLALYRTAVALVQPSVNEGWSTSVEEAKALGKTLIVSDIEVHKEQNDGNFIFFDSLNAEDLAEKLKSVWSNSDTSFPKLDVEYSSFTKYQENVRAFGNRFIEIASHPN